MEKLIAIKASEVKVGDFIKFYDWSECKAEPRKVIAIKATPKGLSITRDGFRASQKMNETIVFKVEGGR